MKTGKILILLSILFVLSALGTLIIVFITGDRYSFKDYKETIDYKDSKSIEGITNIVVGLDVGSVNIVPTDEKDVTITFTGEHYSLFKKKQVFNMEVTEEDETLFIDATVDKSHFIGIMHSTKNVLLTIRIPKTYEHNLSLDVSVGDVTVQDFTLNQFTFSGTTVDLNLNNLTFNRGQIELSTGDIDALLLGGDVDLSLKTGDVELIHRGETFDIDISLRTGSVELVLPQEAKFDLHAETFIGDIENEFPIIQTEQGRNKLIGYVGESGLNQVQIEIRTGSIEIESK